LRVDDQPHQERSFTVERFDEASEIGWRKQTLNNRPIAKAERSALHIGESAQNIDLFLL